MTSPWSNNSQFALLIITSGGVATGLFVYNGNPGAGNPPVFSVVAPGVTADPFGNHVDAVMQAGVPGTGQTTIDASGRILLSGASGTDVIQLDPANQQMLVYSDPPALHSLLASLSAQQTVDGFGNQVRQSVAGYGTDGSAVILAGDRMAYYDGFNVNFADLVGSHAAQALSPTAHVVMDWAWVAFRSILFGGIPVDQVVALHPGTAGTAETPQAFAFTNGWTSGGATRATPQYFLNAAPATAGNNSVHVEGSLKVPPGGFVGGQQVASAAPAGYRPNNVVSILGMDVTNNALARFTWGPGGAFQVNQQISGALAPGDIIDLQPTDFYLNN